MMEVRQYSGSEAFGKGIDVMGGKGWVLHSWQMLYDQFGSLTIVAVFRGRQA